MKNRSWVEEHIYFDREEYFRDLLDLITASLHSIEMESYIFEMDGTGKKVIAALSEAASRGVRVRVVIDGMGTWFTQEKIKVAFQSTRVQLRIYHPFSFFGLGFSHVNKRLHRKLCIIDHEVAFTGSFNITDLPNRDTGVRLKGGPMPLLIQAFERVWNHEGVKSFRRPSPGWVRLNENKKMRRNCNHDLVRRIRDAKKRIWVTNAYFVPPLFLLRVLCQAGLRGLDVCLLLPAHPDHVYMKWMSEAFYRTLLLSGVRVFEFGESFLHSKTLIIDDWVMVGSTNLNHRSLVHDLEMDVVLHQKSSHEVLDDQFSRDLLASKELDLKSIHFSWASRFIQWLLHFFRFYA